MTRTIAALALAAIMGIAFDATAQSVETLSNSADGVTVKAKPKSFSPAAAAWEFEVVLDTHSQNLRDDLARTATLVAPGAATQTPLSWVVAPKSDSHHLEGVVSFRPIVPRPDSVELRIQRAGESGPRTFRWSLK